MRQETSQWIDMTKFKATQSSTMHNAQAWLAIDGSTNAQWDAGSCTHTRLNSPAWWKVDLGQNFAIEKVKVTNREDCCQNRLDGFKVLVDGKKCADGPAKATK